MSFMDAKQIVDVYLGIQKKEREYKHQITKNYMGALDMITSSLHDDPCHFIVYYLSLGRWACRQCHFPTMLVQAASDKIIRHHPIGCADMLSKSSHTPRPLFLCHHFPSLRPMSQGRTHGHISTLGSIWNNFSPML